MAPSLGRKRCAPVARIVDGEGVFFPNEVARLLGLQRLDYVQLRRLLILARGGEAPVAAKWSRFTFRDIVAMRIALRLAGGEDARKRHASLRLSAVERAVERLREDFGLSNPLLEANLQRDGSRIFAEVAGVRFEPESGQLALDLRTAMDRSRKQRGGIVLAAAARAAVRREAAALRAQAKQLASGQLVGKGRLAL